VRTLDVHYAIMNDVHKSIKTLKDLRIQTGLTQYELSEILEVRGKTVGEWERGVTQPRMSAAKFLLMCNTFNCSLEELVSAIEVARSKDLDLSESEQDKRALVAA
jgi:transcriptional regulator with XRE-family HTH domain